MITLEHFYYGQLIHHDAPAGEARVLAKSTGLDDNLIPFILKTACLKTTPEQTGGAWALVRGNKEVPFILVHAQMMAAGCIYRHFILLPSAILRELQGNMRALATLLDEQMPVYEMLGDALSPLNFEIPGAPATDEQVDDLLELMSFTGNNTKKLESLLSAMVNGTTLVIVNASPDRAECTTIIQGLLTLLPGSTRFSVTFSTFVDKLSDMNASILFASESPDDETVVIYDYESRSVSGEDTKNDYARFIISQLRLDTELVIQQTDALTPTAGWRFKNGYKLSEALAYASHRSRLDKALTNNMPVEVSEVSSILAEDPTLSPELRRTYAHHLLNFSIALEDMDHTDPVAMTINAQPDLAAGIYDIINKAINDGKGYLIFEMLLRWYQNLPVPRSEKWLDLLHRAMLQELDDLVGDHDVEGVNDWMNDVQSLEPELFQKVSKVISRHLIPIAADDSELAGKILLMSMSTMESDEVTTLLARPEFARSLATPLRQYLSAISNKMENPPAGLMLKAAESIGDTGQDLALVMFADMAAKADYYDIFDAESLAALTKFAGSGAGEDYRPMLAKIAAAFDTEHITKLKQTGGRSVLQLLLLGAYYSAFHQQLSAQSRDLYGLEYQAQYFRTVFKVFADTPMQPAQAQAALKALEDRQTASIIVLIAGIGTLQATGYSDRMQEIADKHLMQLTRADKFQEALHPEIALTLLHYYLERANPASIQRATQLVAGMSARSDGKTGLAAIQRAYQMLSKNTKLRQLAFGLLQEYVHIAPEKPAKHVTQYYSKELGSAAGERLDMSYRFSTFMGRMDFETWAGALNITVELLQVSAAAYGKSADAPSLNKLRAVVKNMRLRLNESQRRAFSAALMRLAKLIVTAGRQHEIQSSESFKRTDTILKGTDNPRSVVEVFRVAGGHLSRGQHYHLRLKAAPAASPLGDIAPADLLVNLGIAGDILEGTLKALPPSKSVTWTSDQVTKEFDSLRRNLHGEDVRELLRQLAIDLQKVAELIVHIQTNGDNSVIESDSRSAKRIDNGNNEPASTLEMYRFFATTIRRS